VAVQAATNAALAEHGFAPANLDQVKAGMVKPTVPRMAGHAGISPEDGRAQRLNDAFYRHASVLFPPAAKPFAGIAALVRGHGLPQAVVTNNLGTMVRETLARCDLLSAMATVLGDGDLPAAKPDPRGPWMAAAACAVDPATCAYVGDSAIDRETARSAGMIAIGVTWGTTPRAAMQGFDLLCDSPEELLALLCPGSAGFSLHA
jgi:phosphoglycolate phosphatase